MKYLLTLLFVGLFMVAIKISFFSDNEEAGKRQWVIVKEIEKDNLTVKTLTTQEFFTISTKSPNNLVINLKRCSTKDFCVGDTVMFVKLRKPAR